MSLSAFWPGWAGTWQVMAPRGILTNFTAMGEGPGLQPAPASQFLWQSMGKCFCGWQSWLPPESAHKRIKVLLSGRHWVGWLMRHFLKVWISPPPRFAKTSVRECWRSHRPLPPACANRWSQLHLLSGVAEDKTETG